MMNRTDIPVATPLHPTAQDIKTSEKRPSQLQRREPEMETPRAIPPKSHLYRTFSYKGEIAGQEGETC